MRPKRRFRAPFVITLASVAAASALACGGSTSNDSNNNTGGASTGGKSGSGGSGGSGNGGAVGGGGSGGATGGSGGSGNVSGSGGATGCPTSFPSADTACSLPSGTKCSYPQGQCCPPWEAICQDGKWQGFASSCNPPYVPCPVEPPAPGSACGTDPCAGNPQYCTYGQCADGTPYTTAQCTNGTWNLQYANCGPAPCEALTACECFDRPDCEATSSGCICQCDYKCPGDPPCACDCGGGTYLGCKTKPALPGG